MKKLLIGTFLLSAAAGFAASNKMSMVTYFPVPYVAYSQVNVSEQMDIGLTDTCSMSLGCDDSSANLTAKVLNLNKGQLDLNGGLGVDGKDMTLGSVVADTGKISFKNVRVQSGKMESLNAGTMNVSKLKLFGKEFPACAGKGGSNGQMHWKTLTLDGANTQELYLVCGDTAASAVDPEPEPETPPTGKKRCLSAMKNCEWSTVNCGYTDFSSCPGGESNPTQSCNGLRVTHAIDQRALELYYPDVYKKYEVLDYSIVYGNNSSCKLNGECNSCVVGKKYVTNQVTYSTPEGLVHSIFYTTCKGGNNSYNAIFLAQYATCYEVNEDEDCGVEQHKNCANTEKYGGALSGLDPLQPSLGENY